VLEHSLLWVQATTGETIDLKIFKVGRKTFLKVKYDEFEQFFALTEQSFRLNFYKKLLMILF